MIEIKVGTATCGNAAGAQKTLEILKNLSLSDKNIIVGETGCIGMCYREPLVEITKNGKKYLYGDVTDKIAEKIFNDHIVNDKVVENILISKTEDKYQFNKQRRIVLRNTGIIDPE
ncbi:MAG TPA: (2Fe-2S) ferredoxin domain-containing protein, partial [Spirochaetota bacterium]|nr:(2Fe-2S) ferredoxin domain-containing protein [Spirochaetota bacterium]